MTINENPHEYIGDGVYAEFDGFMVILKTDRMEGTHWIALDPSVLEALNLFWKQMHEPSNEP